MKKISLLLMAMSSMLFVACDKEDEESNEPNPGSSSLTVPDTYMFTDSEGNSTVNYTGQAQRLEMLGEMTTYMKSANTPGVALDAQVLKNMYANSGYSWADATNIDMNNSSKQLKNKTAAAPSGAADPNIQMFFEGYMDEIATLSGNTVDGQIDGGENVGGVVLSTTNPAKQYLQDANGMELTQLIEKGLMGAVFYNQIVMNYLGDAELSGDNTAAVDAANGKFYTDMEHAWDEAYGYFTTATDYVPGGTGASDRFWAKYAAGSREDLMGTATKIDEAFRRGRAAISAGDMDERDLQRAIIRTEMQKVVAGTAVHYLNSTISNLTDDALRNHALSEAIAFISGLPYGYEAIADQQQVQAWYNTIGFDLYEVSPANLLMVRDEIASLADIEAYKEDL